MPVHAYLHSRLMEESEARVEMAAHFGSPADMLVASRILHNPDAYRRWEAEHDRLMRAVSEQVRLPRQVVALRSTAFALVHRKAIFEYLRDRQITGARRHRVFALFYGIRDYGNAVLAEHGVAVVADRKSTRLNSSHRWMSYAGFCLKKKQQ